MPIGLHVLAEIALDLAEPAKHLVPVYAPFGNVLDQAVVARHRGALGGTLTRLRELFTDVAEKAPRRRRHEQGWRRRRRRNVAHDFDLEEREQNEAEGEQRHERRFTRHGNGYRSPRGQSGHRAHRIVDGELHERAALVLGNAREGECIRDPAAGAVMSVERNRAREGRPAPKCRSESGRNDQDHAYDCDA